MGNNSEISNAVEQALGKPFAVDLSEPVRKIRMNLLIASFIALIIVYANISIMPSSTFFGLTFKGVTDRLILHMLIIINIYTWCHFAWCAVDNVMEWRLRLSGTRLAFQTGSSFGSEHADYTSDPRQSTLYNWWRAQSRQLPPLLESVNAVQQQLTAWEDKIGVALKGDPNIVNAVMSISAVKSKVEELNNSLGKTQKIIEAARIPVSLNRFDRAFHLLLTSQNLRWLVFEFGLPILMGLIAIMVLAIRIHQGAGLNCLSA